MRSFIASYRESFISPVLMLLYHVVPIPLQVLDFGPGDPIRSFWLSVVTRHPFEPPLPIYSLVGVRNLSFRESIHNSAVKGYVIRPFERLIAGLRMHVRGQSYEDYCDDGKEKNQRPGGYEMVFHRFMNR